MRVVYDEDEDGKWITIHPSGAVKGRHVKVNGEGEIVAGNKHLVAALKEGSGASKENGKGGGGEETDDIGPILSAELKGGEEFAPFDADDFGDLFEEFKPPEDDAFTGLLDDGTSKESEEDDKETTVGKVIIDGQEIRIGFEGDKSKAIDYVQRKLLLYGGSCSNGYIDAAIRGVPSHVNHLDELLGADDPLMQAIHERIDYVNSCKNGCRDISSDANEITQSEADAIINEMFSSISTCAKVVPSSHCRKISKEEQKKKIRYIACAMRDFAARFPDAQLLGVAKKTTFLIEDIVQPSMFSTVVGDSYVNYRAIRIDHSAYDIDKTSTFKGSYPLNVSPHHGDKAPRLSVLGYWPDGSSCEGVLIHELAHQYAKKEGSIKKFKEALGNGSESYGALYINKIAPDVSRYATSSPDEFHSEVVATIASPMYIQGSLPEEVERYVYEEVLGCAPGTWKKRETLVK